jgi:uncharacterized damage-inducible protein DinB
MKPSQVQALFDYTFWAFDLTWSAINNTTDAQFTAELPYSHGSIRNIVVHLISSHRRWLARLSRTETPPHLAFDAFPSRQSVWNEWQSARTEWESYLATLTQEALDEPLPYEIPARAIKTNNSRWEILIHLVNHSTDHRSQILALLSTQFGISTPEHDFIIYLWQQHGERS